MDRYEKDKIIGSGTFGNVFLVKSKLSRQAYVLKEVSLNSLSESDQQQALNEVSVLAKCKHKHIVRYKEAERDLNQNILSIVMEYADGGKYIPPFIVLCTRNVYTKRLSSFN